MNRLSELEMERESLKAQIKVLQGSEEPMQPENTLSVQVQTYTCNWCNKEEFDSRTSVFEHILECKPKSIGIVKPTEKLFTCQICGVKLNRYDMKDHGRKCSLNKSIKELEEKIKNYKETDDPEKQEQLEGWKYELDHKIQSLRSIS